MSKDNETSNFPKVGDEGITSHVVNISGQRSPYTKVAGKEGFGKNDNPPNSHKSNKGATLIRNANGPACRVVSKISYPNSPESGKTQRNVKRVQGPYSFELSRAQAGNTQGV